MSYVFESEEVEVRSAITSEPHQHKSFHGHAWRANEDAYSSSRLPNPRAKHDVTLVTANGAWENEAFGWAHVRADGEIQTLHCDT